MPGKLKLSEIVPRYKLTQKKYKFIVEALKDVGVGVVVAFLLVIFIEGVVSYKYLYGLAFSAFLWYIGLELSERT